MMSNSLKTEEIREDVLQSIKRYFETEQWNTLQDRVDNDPINTLHAHIFVDTMLHPDTFSDVLKVYYKVMGREIDRTIDMQPSNVGHNMLHGVHPTGSFHYDVAWRYNNGEAISPMPQAFVKEKNNLQIWDEQDIEQFFSQYQFIQPEGEAKVQLEQHFESKHWEETCEYVEHPNMAHFHANVEMSVHPDALRDEALKAIEKQGWKLQKVLHCIFSPTSDWITGKVVFMLHEPEVMWDIAWKFNKNVVIRPSTVPFMMQDRTEFDIRYKEKMEYYTDQGEDFIVLNDIELKRLKTLFEEIK